MLDPRRHLSPRTVAFAAAALALAWPGARPARAEENDAKAGHALIAPIFAYNETAAAVFLTNTGDAAARALVAVRGPDNALVGCGSGLLRSGEADVLYLRPKSTPDTALTVKIYGFRADRPLDAKAPVEQTGLAGSVTLLDGATGEPIGLAELIAVPTTAKARSADLEDCLRAGFGATIGSGGAGPAPEALSSEAPTRWGGPDQAPTPTQ